MLRSQYDVSFAKFALKGLAQEWTFTLRGVQRDRRGSHTVTLPPHWTTRVRPPIEPYR